MPLDSLPTSACDNGCASWCDCPQCFEHWFCQIREHLYPSFVSGTLCKNGAFDGVMMAFLRPLWDVMRNQCGTCNFPRELDPVTACCLVDCWATLFGLPDDCFDLDAEVCWTSAEQRLVGKRAQLFARALMEWHNWPDRAFFERLGCPLGIEISICAPTPLHRHAIDDVDACELVPDWPVISQFDPTARVCPDTHIGTAPACRPFGRKIEISITAAPRTIYATMCDPISQPLCWNPYVDAYKCIVEKLKPCNLHIRWRDAYEGNWTSPPTFDDLCPTDLGFYRSYPIAGEGTTADPYRVDWSLLSPADAAILAAKLAAQIETEAP